VITIVVIVIVIVFVVMVMVVVLAHQSTVGRSPIRRKRSYG